MNIVFLIMFFVFGACIGSFLECFCFRYTTGVSIIKSHRSFCNNCKHKLAPYDLIPIISYLLLKGHCRFCKTLIPPRIFISECLCAVIYTLIFLKFEISIAALSWIIFLSLLYLAAIIDIDTMTIPNGIFLILIILRLFLLAFDYNHINIIELLISGIALPGMILVISLILEKILKKQAIGGGDIKLLIPIGLFFGLLKTLLSIIIFSLIGLMYAFIKKKGKDSEFPLAPFIFLSSTIVVFLGDKLIMFI